MRVRYAAQAASLRPHWLDCFVEDLRRTSSPQICYLCLQGVTNLVFLRGVGAMEDADDFGIVVVELTDVARRVFIVASLPNGSD